nr:hypothetical protein CFP56_45784 [Quercus suber]
MRVFWLAGLFGLVKGWKQEFNYEQKCGLVYVKLRCVKDRALDAVAKRFWVEKENAWRLKEWQMLPYTSLHSDVSHLDLDPDVCKKRIGVFHELLHFTA